MHTGESVCGFVGLINGGRTLRRTVALPYAKHRTVLNCKCTAVQNAIFNHNDT